jgi:hypothetical protein
VGRSIKNVSLGAKRQDTFPLNPKREKPRAGIWRVRGVDLERKKEKKKKIVGLQGKVARRTTKRAVLTGKTCKTNLSSVKQHVISLAR